MIGTALTPERIASIQRGLLTWFDVNARKLPWRATRDPYAILVSEVMLQQTQVDRVVPYYTAFLERFPTAEALAAAPVAEVIRLWSGLGYNRRAVSLQRAAKAVVDELQGEFPDDPERLRTLPGVGAYTAGAVAAFAFERDVAFIDTNMRRVLTRLAFGVEPASDQAVLATAAALLPPGKGWAWNQALIEFGALQCTARAPDCVICPLQGSCAAFPIVQTAIVEKRSRRTRTSQPFETTTRYYRGRIVDALRALPAGDNSGIDVLQLGPKLRDNFSEQDVPWLRALVEGLQRDGLALIAEEQPPYDEARPERGTAFRVRLP